MIRMTGVPPVIRDIYLSAMAFLAMQADEKVRECIAAVLISVLSIWAFIYLISTHLRLLERFILNRLVSFSATSIGRACFGIGIVY